MYRIRDWFIKNTENGRARWWLGALSFGDSSFFPVPPDVMLIPMVISGERRWVQLALFTTLFSVLGALFGYIIGSVLFEYIGQPLIDLYNLQAEVAQVGEWFKNNEFLTMFVGAFTPLPYKVFTISGGFFGINLVVFVVASTLGRFARYGIIGGVSHVFGETVLKRFMKYANVITALIVLALIAYVVVGLL